MRNIEGKGGEGRRRGIEGSNNDRQLWRGGKFVSH